MYALPWLVGLLAIAAVMLGLWMGVAGPDESPDHPGGTPGTPGIPGTPGASEGGGENKALPEPRVDGETALEATMAARRSVRAFQRGASLAREDLAQLLWSAQGVTEAEQGLRTAPSAGGTYPMVCYAVVGDVADLPAGVYRYDPDDHALSHHVDGDLRRDVAAAALNQNWLAEAPVVFVIAAVYERTAARYGDRAERYVHMEAGHVGQNIALQAVALSLGITMVGAFDDAAVSRRLELPDDHAPLYIIPTGPPRNAD